MNNHNRLAAAFAVALGIGVSAPAFAGCPGTLTLPAQSPTNSVTFGDGISYSLPILGIDVQSSPGQIDDCIVVATGSNGQGVTTNFAGMDNAYATPNGSNSNPYFRTGDPTNSPDPGGGGEFAGDTTTTWDTQLSALKGFLGSNDMVVYFNHNQTKSGSAIDEDLFVWAQIALVDLQDSSRTLYFYITSVPNATGFNNFGQPGGDPTTYTGPQTPATCTYPTGSDSACTFPKGGVGTGTGSGDASFMVQARGKICLNGPVGVGTAVPCSGPHVAEVDENLGADHVANAVVFPEINAILATAGFNGYDVLQADIRMGCNASTITGGTCSPGSPMNNGYEQIFIDRLSPSQGPPGVPEPATLALVSLGLFGAAALRRRRSA